MLAAFDHSLDPIPGPAWHPKTRRIFDYWQDIHPDEGMPGRQHFDPMAVPELLPNLWLLEVQPEPFRLRYRLAGTNVVRARGIELTGRWVDEANYGIADVDAYQARFRRVIQTNQPNWRRGAPRSKHLPWIGELENIILPLARDGRTVDLLLCCTLHYDRRGQMIDRI